MRSIIPILCVLLLMGCAPNPRYTTRTTSPRKQHTLYTTTPQTNDSKVEVKGTTYQFVTSYYAQKFHGRPTSSGEIFDMYKLTCAHKSLPFGTMLKVTNPDTGQSVVVKVNDRGPFIDGRDLDLSYAAAQKVGLVAVGVKTMNVEVLNR